VAEICRSTNTELFAVVENKTSAFFFFSISSTTSSSSFNFSSFFFYFSSSIMIILLLYHETSFTMSPSHIPPALCQLFLHIMWHSCYCSAKTIPVQAGRRVPGGWGSQTSKQSTHEDGKVIIPTGGCLTPQEIYLVLISVRAWADPGP